MDTFISHSPEETQALGEKWGREARHGWVIGLSGDLGVGKTHLVKGIATGMGIVGRIQSPTFALVNEHRSGRLPLFHVDLYRLESVRQIVTAGLESYLVAPDGVAVIEWIDRWLEGQSPEDSGFVGRRVHFRALNETEREITYEDIGD